MEDQKVITDGFGKRVYFDSSHYSIIRRWHEDTILMLESITNRNTKIESWIEYYSNGKVKDSGEMTSVNHNKIGEWKYYSESGKLDSIINYDSKYPISYKKALSIAAKNGYFMPEIEIFQSIEENNRYWKVIRWTEQPGGGGREGDVLLIDIIRGKISKPDYETYTVY
ncbi:MAG: hypothetical protein ACFHU9_13165 [Fluviicola sp.]